MSQPLLTYRDAYEHMLDVYDLWFRDTGQKGRALRRAIEEAYRVLPSMHDWWYFRRQSAVQPTTPYSTGTVAYTASSRTLTLTGGTWPASAAEGYVELENIRYPVESRTSNSVIVLQSGNSPESNLDAGTAYEWVRFHYLLPVNVGDVLNLHEADTAWINYTRVSPEEIMEMIDSASSVNAWSVVPSRRYPGRFDLVLADIPATPPLMRYSFKLRFWSNPTIELKTGTVSVSGTTATFSTAVLTSSHVGCVLRTSSSSTVPTSHLGISTENAEVLNAPEYERIITAVSSTTVAILNESATVSAKAYTISSLIDVNSDGMWDYFLRMCEHRYNIISRADPNIQNRSAEMEAFALRQAAIADQRLFMRISDNPLWSRGELVE